MSDLDQRIGALEDELKHRDKRITELKAELDEARALVADMEEHVRECSEITESWIEAFQMRRTDDGKGLVWASFRRATRRPRGQAQRLGPRVE